MRPPSIVYHEFDPQPRFSQHVASYWGAMVHDVAPGHLHQVIPDGCVSLIASRRADGSTQLTLQGPRLSPLWIPVLPGDQFWGVRFWPDMGPRMVRRPARGLRDVIEPAAGTLGAVALELASAQGTCRDAEASGLAWGDALDEMLRRCPPIDTLVRVAVVAIVAARGEAPLGELAAAVHRSPRQLQRRFSDAVGLSPKQFARVRRLRSALQHLVSESPMSWSAVAAELGFADQAHLIREFSALSGLTPVEVAERVRNIGHGGVRP